MSTEVAGALKSTGAAPPEPRKTILNPIYLLVCELAAARGLSVEPPTRFLKLPIGDGWWADLSTSGLPPEPEAKLGRFLLRLHRGPLTLLLDPFSCSEPMLGFAGELTDLLRLAIHGARLARRSGKDETRLVELARLLRELNFAGLLLRTPDPDLNALGTLAFYVPPAVLRSAL
jgi:hypothetical protein